MTCRLLALKWNVSRFRGARSVMGPTRPACQRSLRACIQRAPELARKVHFLRAPERRGPGEVWRISAIRHGTAMCRSEEPPRHEEFSSDEDADPVMLPEIPQTRLIDFSLLHQARVQSIGILRRRQ